jgi:hypothetical protein
MGAGVVNGDIELQYSPISSGGGGGGTAAGRERGGGVARQGALGLGDVCGHAWESGILDRWVVAGAERRKERS